MKIFWLVLIITYILNMVAEKFPSLCYVTGKDGRKEEVYKPNKKIYVLIVSILVLVAGLQSGIGDTWTYKSIFDTIPANIIEFLSNSSEMSDRGFYFLVAFIKQFVANNNQVIIFMFALFTTGLICYSLYKYTEDTKMAIFLFIAMGCFITSMNGIRQYVAAAMLFSTVPLIQERKLIPYLIIVYLASTIHASAIIFYPVYFFNRVKGWGVVSYIIIAAGLFLFVTHNTTGPIIAEILGETQYGHYADALMSTDQGANILRVLVAFVPVVLSWIGKLNINQNLKYGNIMINMSILNAIVMLLATRYWIYARFCIYFNLFSIVLLCYCLNNMFTKESTKIIKFICLVCYIVFFWYDCASMGMQYISDILKI